ncbi:MAG: c-type cytochrome [Bacteroidota bacterium]
MKYYPKRILIITFALFAFMLTNANEGEELFKKTCAPCHTVGGGRLVGPDLKNISEKRDKEWIIAFVQSSQTVINSGDGDAMAIYKEYNNMLMPDQPMDGGQVQSIINYIDGAGTGTSDINQEAAPDMLANATVEDIAMGLQLFTGNKRLQNGGASCISCHKVKDDRVFSSGTLAKELTETYGIMGSAGVSAILKSPPFPAMGVTYKNNALTPEEILSLTAYLKSVSDNHIYQHPVAFGSTFAIFGIVVFIMILLSIIVLYFNRKKGSVNDKILNRQSPVIN